jgi:microtubule-associated protein-like 6
MSSKPWLRNIEDSRPSDFIESKQGSQSPAINLDLEYVYGYRCHDTRNNLYYSPKGKLVYHTAAVGIVLDPLLNTQKFMFEHNDDIISMAVHKKYVATGQVGSQPIICIWDCDTMETYAVLQGILTHGIAHLAFSADGNKLAAVGLDPKHTIAVYDLEELK